jgi:hypothetical protein
MLLSANRVAKQQQQLKNGLHARSGSPTGVEPGALACMTYTDGNSIISTSSDVSDLGSPVRQRGCLSSIIRILNIRM